jgi:Beta-propeller domains of methanol dehydrogenase type
MKYSFLVALLSLTTVLGFAPSKIHRFTSGTATGSQLMQTSLDSSSENTAKCRRSILTDASKALSIATLLFIPTSMPLPSHARLEAVNKPDLLPKETDAVIIQTQKFLTSGQVKRMSDMIRSLEKDTGFRLRVLCQNYPNTPGLAIRDYWDLGKEGQKDDKYIVLVVDEFGGRGNVLNFNVGDGVKFALPNVFWTRLSGKYGTVSLNILSREVLHLYSHVFLLNHSAILIY